MAAPWYCTENDFHHAASHDFQNTTLQSVGCLIITCLHCRDGFIGQWLQVRLFGNKLVSAKTGQLMFHFEPAIASSIAAKAFLKIVFILIKLMRNFGIGRPCYEAKFTQSNSQI